MAASVFLCIDGLDIAGLRGFAIIELLIIAAYVIINTAITVSAVVQITQTADPDELVALGNLLANYGTVNVLLLLLPITRSSIVNLFLGISFERAIFYHTWLAPVAVAQLGLHGAAVYASQYELNDLWYYATHPGTLSFLAGVLLVLCAARPFRRRLHAWFLRVHLILFAAFILIGFVHNSLVCIVLSSLVLYAWDWVLRISMWRRPTQVLDVTALPGGVTRVRFQMQAGAFKYHGGQFCFVCIPLVSPWEWHPFSLSSSPHHPVIMMHIKTMGPWTRRLEELARQSELDMRTMSMYIEGPYGEVSLPLERYSSVLMVAGGIGITPLGSLYNELLRDHYLGTRTMRHMRLVWTVRDPKLIASLYTDVREADRAHHTLPSIAPPPTSPSFFSTRGSLATLDERVVGGGGASGGSMPPRSPTQSQQRYKRNAVVPLADSVSCAFHVTAANAYDDTETDALLHSNSPRQRAMKRYSSNKWEEWVQQGRPQLAESFRLMHHAIAPGGSVVGVQQSEGERCAVLACGPAALISEVRQLCCAQSTSRLHFDLHEETFEW